MKQPEFPNRWRPGEGSPAVGKPSAPTPSSAKWVRGSCAPTAAGPVSGSRLRLRNACVLAVALVFVGAPGGTEPPAAPDRAALLASLPEDLREPVGRALDLAGDHAPELIAAVGELENPDQRRWAAWLLAHMQDKAHVRYRADGAAEAALDLSTIPGPLLRENVRLAARARAAFPWAATVPEGVFLEYVLPYRFTEEPLEDWRASLLAELGPVVAGCRTAEEAALAINRWAAGRVKYEARAAEDLGVLAVERAGRGRCEDMSNFVRAALSAVGIPAASVYTPWWPKADGNHAWNEVWIDGRWLQFMGCEPAAEPPFWDRIKVGSVFAKVHRSGFGSSRSQPEDVTSEYGPVRELDLRTDAKDATIELCVMNHGAWRAVTAARSDSTGRVRFPAVGCREPILFRLGLPDGTPPATPFVLRAGAAAPESVDPTPVRGARAAFARVVLEGLAPDASHALLAWNGNWEMLAVAPSDERGVVDFGPLGRPRTMFAVGRRTEQSISDPSRPFLFEPDEQGALRRVKY